MNRYELGKLGEEAVAIYLEKRGYHTLNRNFRIRNGEIDIIFTESNTLIFGEVKTRTNEKFGLPCQAVDIKKMNKIINVARYFIACNNIKDMNIRFDIFEVYYKERKIRHIKNAYELR
ncbi:YraN family protein [Peptostreptococcus equinus]|uniref:UPF0102 protein O0R46_05805 n=1 Tax=Peptostreptococcus equinus TaxID=3003601 RepID=A0ABY7JM06_9FIRM|nr:YraN family protein [Peptostreptococcus sp. CBA3647]WAW14120.1 YraN family protein [Peptostreptococcus sp. CBA3647]